MPTVPTPDPTDDRAVALARVRTSLGGQSAPASSTGHGVRVLWRCPQCGRPLLQDGPRQQPRLDEAQARTYAAELGGDLATLPYATCLICTAALADGAFDLDEWNSGAGYGLSYEGAEPVGTHILLTIFDAEKIAADGAPIATIITNFAHCRAVLDWVHKHLKVPATTFEALTAGLHMLDEEDCLAMAAGNTPGHGAPGTEDWRWYGATWGVRCPPLGAGLAQVVVMQALPPGEDDAYSLRLNTLIARLLLGTFLDGHIAGEVPA